MDSPELLSRQELTDLLREASEALDLARSLVDYPVTTLGEAIEIIESVNA